MGSFNPLTAGAGIGANMTLGMPAAVGKGAQAAGGKGGGAPSAPDFQAIADRQTQQNRPTQNSPFASSQWTRDANGNYTQNVGLNGALGGAATGLQNQFAQANANPLDNGAQARQHAEDAIYSRSASRLDPRFAQEQHNMETQLANQGIDPSSQAYATALGNFGRSKNDAYQQAQYGAIEGGGQEAQRQQGMDIQSRMAPLAGMQGLQGLTGMPGFAQSQLLPAAMAQYQGDLQKYGIEQQGKNSTMGGLTSMATMLPFLMKAAPVAAAASDERLKEDVIRHPMELLPGVPVATFRYKWEPEGTVHVGVIAQDLERLRPDLVTFDPDGYRMVPGHLLLR